ncbi:MAG TPA: sigma-70 family RNA polymerase sigma factor [Verrucomicrobiae bacterium]|jgi:RNA polymerase sigma factor (sigma-70 family)
MSQDAELLDRYAKSRSEPAFAELVGKHVDLVYSAAIRMVNGDTHRAQDVTQQVFTELARRAGTLARHPALAGWLYTTSRQMACRAIRSEQRRVVREQTAHSMNEAQRQPEADLNWEQLRPVLDEAMHELNQTDRLAVLLRFFQNKTRRNAGCRGNRNRDRHNTWNIKSYGCHKSKIRTRRRADWSHGIDIGA